MVDRNGEPQTPEQRQKDRQRGIIGMKEPLRLADKGLVDQVPLVTNPSSTVANLTGLILRHLH